MSVVLILAPFFVFTAIPVQYIHGVTTVDAKAFPNCGPISGFSIEFDARGFTPNGLVHWKLIHSDGSKTLGPFGTFETDENGSFSEVTYIEGLSPDVYRLYFFDDLDNDGKRDPGGAEFEATISTPCTYTLD